MRLVVERFPGGKVSHDGKTLTLRMEAKGGEHALEFPSEAAGVLMQALASLAHFAYRRQLEVGEKPLDPLWLSEPPRVASFTVERRGSQALVRLLGRQSPQAPLSMGVFMLEKDLVCELGRRLLEVAEDPEPGTAQVNTPSGGP
jgi:hypothetical protein